MSLNFCPREGSIAPFDSWNPPVKVDDTADDKEFIAAARQIALDNNVQAFFVIVFDENGKLHLVLSIDKYIIDKRFRVVMTKDTLINIHSYRWLYKSDKTPERKWIQVIE